MRGAHHYCSTADRLSDFDLEKLLHPARAFENPAQVVEDPDLTLNEKRAILASWASDACAVEAVPGFRRPPGVCRAVSVDEILAALRNLDRLANPEAERAASLPHEIRQRWFKGLRGRREGGQEGSGPAVSG